MNGFFFSNTGGVVAGRGDYLMGELLLPPGRYVVSAKANIAIGSSRNLQRDTFTTAYQVTLEFGGDSDEIIGGLVWDSDDPGSRGESVSLMVAGEVEQETPVSLKVLSSTPNRLYCWRPRISAVQLEELHMSSEFSRSRPRPRLADALSDVYYATVLNPGVLAALFGDED